MADLEVGDAVHVSRDARQLEGVIAYIGGVDFSSGDDWIGVRLTGASVGLGKNNGTVQGRQYFTCPASCGIFVRQSAVSKRDLTKLEELKLKRELAKSASSSVASGGAASSTSNKTPPRTTPTRTSPATTTRTTSSAIPRATPPRSDASEAPANKLEELRARREALKARKATTTATTTSTRSPATKAAETTEAASAPAAPADASVATSDNQAELEQVQGQLAAAQQATKDAQSALDSKLNELEDVKRRFSTLERANETAQAEIKVLRAKVEAAALATAQATPQVPPTRPAPTTEQVEALQDQLRGVQKELAEWKDQAESSLRDVSNLQRDLAAEKKARAAEAEQYTKASAEAAALRSQVQELADQQQQRGSADASHYKEKAKLQADMAALKRKVELLEKEKQELENNLEDLTLDKEQLLEEKESLEDRLEEAKLDAETAQMEVEELKMELEDAQSAAPNVVSSEGAEATAEVEDMAAALSVQNARLREALIRLREQSQTEKMDLTRQLRDVEKDAEAGRALSAELEELRGLKTRLEEEIDHLKDAVEQGAAFESMVEDLSDRIMAIEDDNILLRTTIRELEEAAELTAEMEEVQAEELKALTSDLESRDTIIRNLEEAIKMQRRREDDFVRTVGNYRTTVATLKQEKQALLELQQGGEGEKSDLIAASQSALARAAQLVSNAAEMRRRDAVAVMDRIDQQTYKHLSFRLETLLPQTVTAAEVSAIKGELLASKVVSRASRTLEGVAASFGKVIRPALSGDDQETTEPNDLKVELSDEGKQKVKTMLYQAEFAHEVIGLSSDLVRLLAAGQWPDLLSHESSIELGSILGHSSTSLDSALAVVLKSLKEEGALTSDQSNIGALRQTVQACMQSMRSDIERDDGTLLSADWKPPGWDLMRHVSMAKYSCHGAAAALSAFVNQSDKTVAPSVFIALYNRVEQMATQSNSVGLRLANLDLRNEGLVTELTTLASEWSEASMALLKSMDAALLSSADHKDCSICVERVLHVFVQLSATLRSANLNPNEKDSLHALSPEADDPWGGVASLARAIRAIDGDEDDVNYLARAREIEHHLTEAVENEPKFAVATAKVASLEKSLSSKTKELSMQAARLSELEKLMAKSNAGGISRGQSLDVRSSDEFNKLQEENRVLAEAMDVLHRQVDEYENEIRALKDFKSPGRGAKRTPRRAMTSVTDVSPYGRGGTADDTNPGALEATLFRPALQRALRDASKWKASAVGAALSSLSPLPLPPALSTAAKDKPVADDLLELTSAMAQYRMEKASFSLVDLSNRSKSPKIQLRESYSKNAAASEKLQAVMLRCHGRAF